MSIHRTIVKTFSQIVFLLLIILSASQLFATTYTVRFGGPIYGYSYFPDSVKVFVGDTIKFLGDFKAFPLQSVSVPAGAKSFGPIDTGNIFLYVATSVGNYTYQNKIYSPIGMKGSFRVFRQIKGGITNEGREFYLGMLYPSYYSIASSSASNSFNLSASISSYYDNKVLISYFDQSGRETAAQTYSILAGKSLQVVLDYASMQMDTASDGAAFKSCHIISKYPVTVFYKSVGVCAGGSYLALPVLGLGKNYVASCYNDNPGNGALYNSAGSNYYLPGTFEYAGGEFLVIATEDATSVKITPTATTVAGHPGANTGAPHPYTIILNKGQCYLARSNGREESHDLSGSLIESTTPVVVISGHENAYLGGVDPSFTLEGRDLMIEQMIPVEYWDSSGYISVPFAEAIPPSDAGHGDSYRLYCFDNTTVKAHLDVQGINGGYDMTTTRLASPPEKLDVTAPAEAYSLDGKKISLVQYDERSLTLESPWPAPSMMAIVPLSRWKTSYFFSLPPTYYGAKYTNTIFVNILASNLTNINVSIDGKSPVPLSNLTRIGGYSGISNHFPNLKASQYRFSAGFSYSYYLFSNEPFMVYYNGIYDFSPGYLGDIKNHSSLNFIAEYSAPAGMQLNTGVDPSFKISTDSTCTGWHICVRDTGNTDPGIKAVMLIDDPDGIYFPFGGKFTNVGFEESAPDYYDKSELHPHVHSAGSYCFDVKFTSPLEAASAPLAIIDNSGNTTIIRLERSASVLKLSTNPPAAKPDSIVFPVKKIGDQICTTFVFKNTAPIGGTALNLNSANFTNNDQFYKLQSVTPSLPHSLAPQDSLTLQVCYTPLDSARHKDSLIMKTDCFSFAIFLDAHGSTGLISASDLDFPSISVGDTMCKDVLIKNVGSAPFTLTKQFVISDSINFSVDTSKLPNLIPVGATITINVCFHPKAEGSFSAGIDWGTDLEASFAHSIKSHSSITGNATPKAGVKMNSSSAFSIYPNPANGNSAIVTFGNGFSGTDFSPSAKDGRTEVRPTNGKTSLSMFDVLGREVYHQNILSDITRIEIPLRNIPEGVYYVQFNSPSGSVSQKFVRNK